MGIVINTADSLLALQGSGDPFDAKILGERLRIVREGGGYDQVAWGAKIGKVSQTISNWELGRSSPTYADLLKYSSILGADLHWLLTGQKFEPSKIVQAMLRVVIAEPPLP
jgi:transcriptional regulator with XRE-family HTH domain